MSLSKMYNCFNTFHEIKITRPPYFIALYALWTDTQWISANIDTNTYHAIQIYYIIMFRLTLQFHGYTSAHFNCWSYVRLVKLSELKTLAHARFYLQQERPHLSWTVKIKKNKLHHQGRRNHLLKKR